jgi:hypothetical protein
MDTPPPIPYLLLFRNTGPENYSGLSSQQRQQLIARWNAWYDDLVGRGLALEGQPLQDGTRVVAHGGRIVDGPFPEAKEAIGGFVRLLVNNLDEATEIAQRHPGLPYGMKIEIRALTDECHLGVTSHHKARAAVLTE